MRIVNKVINSMRYHAMRKSNVYINASATIKGTLLEGFNYVKGGVTLIDCYVGTGSYIRHNCTFVKTKIGKYCSIAPNVRLVCGNHPVKKNVALHPAFYTGKSIAGLCFEHTMEFEEYSYVNAEGLYCEIGNDVWIGSDVIILGGVKIGNGAVIAAGSIVTKDIPPYSVVGGTPAKVLRWRFSKEQIAFLEKLEWWEKDLDWIQKNIVFFDDIDDLMHAESD